MHSSWLFPGASSGPRQSTDAASGDRSNKNSGTSFEINSFVRSLNLQGVHLPGGFPFKGVTTNNNKSELNDAKGGKCLNELLDVLNDSVDRVLECAPQDQSNPTFGCFRSGPEEGNLADLNDLIHLVSATAKEFHDINSEIAAKSVDPNNAAIPVNSPDPGMRTLVHPEYRAKNDEGPVNISVPESTPKCSNPRKKSKTGLANDCPHNSPVQKRRTSNGVEFEDTPTTDEFFTPPELVEIYSENQSPGFKRANLSAESLETLRYFETPRCFLPEVIRLAKAAGFADASAVTRDRYRSNWMPQARRINFDEELWPIGPGGNNAKAFSPYFTGTPSKPFRIRTTERNFITDTERSMNETRSSPIFSGAGEAPAEPLDIVVPTRDREKSLKQLGKREIAPGSSGDSIVPIDIVPISIGAIEIPIENNFVDAPPRKLKEGDVSFKSCAEGEEKRKPQAVGKNISSSISKEPDDANPSSAQDRLKRKACVKVVMKRHGKICKPSKKDDQKKNCSRSDDEDTCEEIFSSTSDSPKICVGQSPMQRFLQESGTICSDDEKRSGSVKGTDSVETQMEIYSKSSIHNNQIGGKQLKPKPSNKMISDNKKQHICCKIPTEPQESPKNTSKRSTSGEANRPVANSNKAGNLKNTQQKGQANNSAQSIRKPTGKSRIQPSTSSSSVPKQSRIAQLTPRIRPNTAETSNKCKEDTEVMTKSKFHIVRKNQSQDVITERSRGQSLARKSEATVKSPRSKSKPRPGTPKKTANSGSEKSVRSDVRSTGEDKNLNPLSSRYENSKSAKCIGSHKTIIPAIRSKTFVCQLRHEPFARRVASKEDYMTNPKSASIRGNSSSSGPVRQLFRKSLKDRHIETKEENLDSNAEDTPFDSRVNTDAEQSCSDLHLSSNSNFDKICLVEFSSNDSMVVQKMLPKGQHMLIVSSASKVNDKECNSRENDNSEQNFKSKVHNKHARSLRMLKNMLSNQGVSVEAVNENAREIRSKIANETAKKSKIPNLSAKKPSAVSGTTKNNTGVLKTSKTLFEKLAVLTEALPDQTESGRIISCDQSVYSFVDYASESATSYARSMRDAEEQCCFPSGSSAVSQSSLNTEKSSESRKRQEIKKQVSTVSTEIDEEYRRNIYIDVAVSPTPSKTEENIKSFEAVETQTRVNVMDKDSETEEAFQPTPKSINVFTETQSISLSSKNVNTDLMRSDNVDATSQMDPAANSKNTASGKDFSDIQCPSKEVNTERPDLFLRSRGVCVKGPRKIDGESQFDPSEKSKDIASGKDYVVKLSVSEDVNTEPQDYLFEDRSVDVFGPSTAEESCQVDPEPVNIVNVAVGEFPVDVKSSHVIITPKCCPNKVKLDRVETVVVKDVDVVQWQSSTTFNTSKINCGSSCSSNSSLVAWRPKYSRISSAEKFQVLGDRVPKEAFVALEMANERALNLYKAIGIYRDKLAVTKVKETILQSSKSIENNQSSINRLKNLKSSSKKTCNFRENSKIKSLLDANLENLQPKIENSLPNESEKNTEAEELEEDITNLIDDLLTNVTQGIECESEYCICEDIDEKYLEEERNVQIQECQKPIKLVEVPEERKYNEIKLCKRTKTLELFLFSRNSLLTVIYGTVCSFVFWALQFSITCDSV